MHQTPPQMQEGTGSTERGSRNVKTFSNGGTTKPGCVHRAEHTRLQQRTSKTTQHREQTVSKGMQDFHGSLFLEGIIITTPQTTQPNPTCQNKASTNNCMSSRGPQRTSHSPNSPSQLVPGFTYLLQTTNNCFGLVQSPLSISAVGNTCTKAPRTKPHMHLHQP